MLIFLRKFVGLVLTTLLTGLFLTLLFVIIEGSSFLAIGLFVTGAFPFVLLIGVPVSFLSDYLTRNLNGKRRMITALVIHSTCGFLAGSVIVMANLLEGLFLVGVTTIAALLFWLVDEMLRRKMS